MLTTKSSFRNRFGFTRREDFMQIDGSSCWITENKTCVGTTETLRARDTRMCGKYQRRKKFIDKVEIRAHDPSTTCMRQIKASLLPHQSRQSMAMDFDTLKSSKYVCVVGAGASGLVSSRELLREGHSVVVLEQNHDLGGQWLYQDVGAATDTVHSSVYASLRLNAPRASMEFTDFMFTPVEGRDTRNFPGHREFFLYLKDFARCFELTELIKFNTEVVHVGMAAATGKWNVRSRDRRTDDGEFVDEIFDAVVVATGHFSLPRLPKIRGMEGWKRKQLHCHVYRIPDPFQDEVVVVVGGSISGPEIAMELVHVAKEVHISTKHVEIPQPLLKPASKYAHLHWHPQIELLCEDGTVLFADGSSVVADTILYCTGYSYSFPFLGTKGVINVDENRIGPLYEHTFPPSLAPSLSFVGIPKKLITFRFFESQARWIAQVLSGKRKLPSAEEMMMKAIEEDERHQELEEPKNILQVIAEKLEYYDRYGDQCDFPHLEDWRKEILLHFFEKCINNIETFRDE